MTERYLADHLIEWRHPHDDPPPLGTKVLIYTHPYGITVIGQWQHSGGSLWAPLPRVHPDMKARLEREWRKD